MLRNVRSYKACTTGYQNSHPMQPFPRAFIAQQNSKDSMLFFSPEPVEMSSLLWRYLLVDSIEYVCTSHHWRKLCREVQASPADASRHKLLEARPIDRHPALRELVDAPLVLLQATTRSSNLFRAGLPSLVYDPDF